MLTQEEQKEPSIYLCESPASAKSTAKSSTSYFSKVHSMFIYLLLTCFRWWTSLKYTPSFSITCNFQQTNDGQCTYCDHKLSVMDTFDHNLIQSIAVDPNKATDLLSSLQKATDMTLCLKSLKQDQKHDPQIQGIIEQLNSGNASRHMQAKYLITSDYLITYDVIQISICQNSFSHRSGKVPVPLGPIWPHKCPSLFSGTHEYDSTWCW